MTAPSRRTVPWSSLIVAVVVGAAIVVGLSLGLLGRHVAAHSTAPVGALPTSKCPF